MELNALIESANQFKSAEEKVAFFIGYQTGITNRTEAVTVSGAAQEKTQALVVPALPIGKTKRCEACNKKMIPGTARKEKRFCGKDENPKCFRARAVAYEMKRRERLGANLGKGRKTEPEPKKPSLNLTPPPGSSTAVSEALARAKAEAENDRARRELERHRRHS